MRRPGTAVKTSIKQKSLKQVLSIKPALCFYWHPPPLRSDLQFRIERSSRSLGLGPISIKILQLQGQGRGQLKLRSGLLRADPAGGHNRDTATRREESLMEYSGRGPALSQIEPLKLLARASVNSPAAAPIMRIIPPNDFVPPLSPFPPPPSRPSQVRHSRVTLIFSLFFTSLPPSSPFFITRSALGR